MQYIRIERALDRLSLASPLHSARFAAAALRAVCDAREVRRAAAAKTRVQCKYQHCGAARRSRREERHGYASPEAQLFGPVQPVARALPVAVQSQLHQSSYPTAKNFNGMC